MNDFEEASSIDMKEAQSDMDASVVKVGVSGKLVELVVFGMLDRVFFFGGG